MNFIDRLNIPPSCSVGNTIFKKLFYDNTDLSRADTELFTDNVDKITWVYCLKPETINIKIYKDDVREYPEIEVVEVTLAQDKKVKRIAEIIMRTIPYPMFLVFRLEDKAQLYVAHQRISQSDSSKNTLDDIISTAWLSEDSALFEKLDIRQMRFTNYHTLYSDIVDAISIFNASGLIRTETQLTGEQARALTEQVEQLEQQIASLRAQLKKETQFNLRVELNVEIKNLMLKNLKLKEGQL